MLASRGVMTVKAARPPGTRGLRRERLAGAGAVMLSSLHLEHLQERQSSSFLGIVRGEVFGLGTPLPRAGGLGLAPGRGCGKLRGGGDAAVSQ